VAGVANDDLTSIAELDIYPSRVLVAPARTIASRLDEAGR
jgi:hypothetical protein